MSDPHQAGAVSPKRWIQPICRLPLLPVQIAVPLLAVLFLVIIPLVDCRFVVAEDSASEPAMQMLHMGALYLKIGDLDMAEATFRSVFELPQNIPGDVRATAGRGLALVLSRTGRAPEALEILEKILAAPDADDDNKQHAKRLKQELAQ